MSDALFREKLSRSRLSTNDIKWMPHWFAEFTKDRSPADGRFLFDNARTTAAPIFGADDEGFDGEGTQNQALCAILFYYQPMKEQMKKVAKTGQTA
jgi:hypothetical protein